MFCSWKCCAKNKLHSLVETLTSLSATVMCSATSPALTLTEKNANYGKPLTTLFGLWTVISSALLDSRISCMEAIQSRGRHPCTKDVLWKVPPNPAPSIILWFVLSGCRDSAPVSFYCHPRTMLKFQCNPQVTNSTAWLSQTFIQANQGKGASSICLTPKGAFFSQQCVYTSMIASINNRAVLTGSKDPHKNWVCCILSACHTLQFLCYSSSLQKW